MFDADHLIADCRAALTNASPELAIKELLERAVSDPGAIEAALGTPRQGEIQVLHRTPELTIINVIWTPGMMINPHDHRMWAAIGLYGGREDNVFHRRGAGGLTVAGARQVESGEVLVLGHAVIHSVSNPLETLTAALHIYGGDLIGTPRSEWLPGRPDECPFDVERARQVFAEANERWRAQTAGR